MQESSSEEAVTVKKLRPWKISNSLQKDFIAYTTFEKLRIMNIWRIGPKTRVALGIYKISAVFLCPAMAPRIQKED